MAIIGNQEKDRPQMWHQKEAEEVNKRKHERKQAYSRALIYKQQVNASDVKVDFPQESGFPQPNDPNFSDFLVR